MRLLDEVVAAAPGAVACRVLIRSDSTFAEDGRVPGLVALEYMAQAVAAYAGLRARGQGQPVRIGYLLGSREVALPPEDFQAGDELLVEARHQFGEDAIGAFDCHVVLRGQVVASACLNVYQGDRKAGT
jgi:predicted hotdog family 3-hydroxylacyl-ACP dehydratase